MSNARPKILIIEDDPEDRFMLRRKLARDYDIDDAGTLADGLAKLDFGRIYCVLLDLNLPDSQPVYTTHRFRTYAPDLPMVVISGFYHEEIVRHAIQAGADSFLIKGKTDDRQQIIRAMRCAVSQRVILNKIDRAQEHTDFLCRALAPA